MKFSRSREISSLLDIVSGLWMSVAAAFTASVGLCTLMADEANGGRT